MGIKDEFTRNNVSLDHDKPEDFYMPRCRCMSPFILVLARAFFTVYTLSILITDISYNVYTTSSPNWLKYLTNWNYIFVVLYFTSAFVVTGSEVLSLHKQHRLGMVSKFADSNFTLDSVDSRIGIEKMTNTTPSNNNTLNIMGGKLRDEYTSYSSFSKRKRLRRVDYLNQREMTCGFKFVWVLRNIAITVTAAIVAGYWTVIHDHEVKLALDLKTYLKIDFHGINLVLLLFDMLLNRLPFRILHFIHPLLLGCIYVIFHITFWSISGDNIYSVIDWREAPSITALAFFGLLFAICLFHFIVYLFYSCVVDSDCKTKAGFMMALLVILFATLLVLTFLI